MNIVRFPTERIRLTDRQLNELMEEGSRELEALLAGLEQESKVSAVIQREIAELMAWQKHEFCEL